MWFTKNASNSQCTFGCTCTVPNKFWMRPTAGNFKAYAAIACQEWFVLLRPSRLSGWNHFGSSMLLRPSIITEYRNEMRIKANQSINHHWTTWAEYLLESDWFWKTYVIWFSLAQFLTTEWFLARVECLCAALISSVCSVFPRQSGIRMCHLIQSKYIQCILLCKWIDIFVPIGSNKVWQGLKYFWCIEGDGSERLSLSLAH